MKMWGGVLTVLLALPAVAQTVPYVTSDGTALMIAPPPDRVYLFADDCLYINGPFYICDQLNAWETLELPEDLQGVGFQFEGGITASVEVMASVWVGIQVRAQRYTRYQSDSLITEELTRIDDFPAVTDIQLRQRDGVDVVIARTHLLLHELDLTAETTQVADSYTPEHAARHAEMLAGITHEWSFD
ncbi:MAG: hypothetical protein V3V13_01565 [Paracoccaceae bacterium]